MAKALDIITSQDFIAEFDDDDEPTVWKLRSLTGVEFLECTRSGFVDHGRIINLGLIGWDNFSDCKGELIKFSREDISRIDPRILQEISLKIQDISMLSEDERKNL